MAALTSRRRRRLPSSSFAIPSKRKYPVDTQARARNAISRVQQNGTAAEKRAVFRKVRSRYPSLAKRSRVIPTRTGTGRRIGQRVGTTNRSRARSRRRRRR